MGSFFAVLLSGRSKQSFHISDNINWLKISLIISYSKIVISSLLCGLRRFFLERTYEKTDLLEYRVHNDWVHKNREPSSQWPSPQEPSSQGPSLLRPSWQISKGQNPKVHAPKFESTKAESTKAESTKAEFTRTELVKAGIENQFREAHVTCQQYNFGG